MEALYTLVFMVITWFGLLLGYWLALINPKIPSKSVSTWRYLSYFTTQANGLIAVALTLSLVNPESRVSLFLNQPSVKASMVLYLSMLCLVYHYVYGLKNNSRLSTVSNLIFHYLVPALTLLYWLLFADKNHIEYSVIVYWIIFPALFLVYTFIHGLWSDFYPYTFVDVAKLGYRRVLTNMLCTILVFLPAGFILVLVAKILH